ncbi:hypothetical protein LCGC14_1202810 [marine sediment metagenome]|uniref:Uncharacterized protein n=1 Tax=marine sediment metagenome TaxID=412755 RepID=A0A0F9LKV7_9ZZZZ
MKKISVREFYYPRTGKWYRFTDTRINGGLLSRVCIEIVGWFSI